jgi:hypothetical protein
MFRVDLTSHCIKFHGVVKDNPIIKIIEKHRFYVPGGHIIYR